MQSANWNKEEKNYKWELLMIKQEKYTKQL